MHKISYKAQFSTTNQQENYFKICDFYKLFKVKLFLRLHNFEDTGLFLCCFLSNNIVAPLNLQPRVIKNLGIILSI